MGRALPMFEAPGVCEPCGGKCCKRLPCATSPDDWGAPSVAEMTSRVTAALATGRWSIDYWERSYDDANPVLRRDVLWVAPALANEDKEDLFYPSNMGGSRWLPAANYPCTFLSPTGCELEHAARPLECRALEPNPAGGCCASHAGGKLERALEWAPYQQVIEKAIATERARGERS